MTTAAMVVAMVPLMFAEGAGAREPRFAIGIVIAFGMSIGTLFTLFVTPAVYTLVARDHARGRGAREGQSPVWLASRRAAAE